MMLDILRDPVWQFIGAFISIIAIVITIITFLIQRNRKQISYEILVDFPILSIDEVFQIVSNGKIVKDARLALLRVWNSGNAPIPPNDYVDSIAFSFGKNAEIIDVKILETYPANLKPFFVYNSEQIVLKPLLLNRKESIKLEILMSGKFDKVYADARIIGVNLILLNLAILLLLLCNLDFLLIMLMISHPFVDLYIITNFIHSLPRHSNPDYIYYSNSFITNH